MSTRGVVDVVLCLDASKSMRPCFDGVRRHLLDFVQGLGSGGQQQRQLDLRFDFLIHSCGEHGPFRASTLRHSGPSLIQALYGSRQDSSSFFTRDCVEIQLALEKVEVEGDEAPLVAMDFALDYPWRPRQQCHRVLICMTDEPFEQGAPGDPKSGFSLADQAAKVPQLIEKFQASGVMLFLVAPKSEVFKKLSLISKSQYKVMDQSGDGLRSIDFGKILEQIGKSVSVANLQAVADPKVQRALFGQDQWVVSHDPLTGA